LAPLQTDFLNELQYGLRIGRGGVKMGFQEPPEIPEKRSH
jgi:hypothetical protein